MPEPTTTVEVPPARLNTTEKREITKIIEQEIAQREREIDVLAAALIAKKRKEFRSSKKDALSSARKLETRLRAEWRRHTEAVAKIVEEAEEEGHKVTTGHYNDGKRVTWYRTPQVNPARVNSEEAEVEKDIKIEANSGKVALGRLGVDLKREVWTIGMSDEAARILDRIPSARHMLDQPALREIG